MSRVNIQLCQPDAYNAMFGLEKYLAGSSVDAALLELMRIRASIINGCKYCTQMHSESAEKMGVDDAKIAAVEHWCESDLFSDREQAALDMTDAVTHISEQGLPEPIYEKAAGFFNEDEMAQLIMLIATINAWNRIGVSMAG